MYRRHNGGCPHKTAKSDMCKCPLYAHGRLHGKRGRWALNTDAWSTGEDRMIAMLRRKPTDPSGGGLHVVGAKPSADMTLAEAEARFATEKANLTETSRELYAAAVRDFRAYAERKKVELLRDVTEDLVRAYIEAHPHWKPRTIKTRLTFLRVWFSLAVEKRWIPVSPVGARSSLMPTVAAHAREPIQPEEVTRILAAIPGLQFRLGRGFVPAEEAELKRARLRAAILLMLYSGLRISDVTFLERAYITDGILDPITIKNGQRLGAPIMLPPVVLDALAALPASRTYFFLPDRDDDYRDARRALQTRGDFLEAVGKEFADYQMWAITSLVKMAMEAAGVEGACHRFRHTFAVNHLDGGGSVYDLKSMLGHSSVVITEKYLSLVKRYRKAQAPAVRYEFPAA